MMENYESIAKQEKQAFQKGLLWGISIMLFIAALVILGIRIFGLPTKSSGDFLSSHTQDKLRKLDVLINEYYIDEVSTEALDNGLYAGLLAALDDPYSQYYTQEEYKALSESTSGSYFGVGAVLSQDPKTMEVTILHVYPNSPAEEAGIKDGDMLVKVDDIDSASMELTNLVQHIKGEEGTKVHLIIAREGETLELDVTRRKVEVPTVESQMVEGTKTGLIQISEFSEVTPEQFEQALSDLQAQGMTALILDMRNNPGGLVSSVRQILDDLLPKGVVVYTEDKNGRRTDYASDDEHQLTGVPIAVLINENSASAAEILAGAVKDFDYGTLIGTTSFGKGIVQQIMPLGDGSAVKITTAKYFTPSGNNIHKVGITPDITIEYDYTSPDDTSYDPLHDNQVMKALEVLKGK